MPRLPWRDYVRNELNLSQSRFFENWFREVYPRANRAGLLGRRHGDHGLGDYSTIEGALNYVARNPIKHYASLVTALGHHYKIDGDELDFPCRPFVVDLGCGPGTAALALLDWLCTIYGEEVAPDITYLGIDKRGMRHWAQRLLRTELPAWSFILEESSTRVSEAEISRLSQGRDGVVFVASYILEQEFMTDMQPLADLIAMIRNSTSTIDADLLIQDVNRFEEHRRRLRCLSTKLGLTDITILDWNNSLSQPRVWVEQPGVIAWEPAEVSARTNEPSLNVFYSFQHIAKPRRENL